MGDVMTVEDDTAFLVKAFPNGMKYAEPMTHLGGTTFRSQAGKTYDLRI